MSENVFWSFQVIPEHNDNKSVRVNEVYLHNSSVGTSEWMGCHLQAKIDKNKCFV